MRPSQLAVASHQRRGTLSILGAGEPSSAASAEIVKRAAHPLRRAARGEVAGVEVAGAWLRGVGVVLCR